MIRSCGLSSAVYTAKLAGLRGAPARQAAKGGVRAAMARLCLSGCRLATMWSCAGLSSGVPPLVAWTP